MNFVEDSRISKPTIRVKQFMKKFSDRLLTESTFAQHKVPMRGFRLVGGAIWEHPVHERQHIVGTLATPRRATESLALKIEEAGVTGPAS
jgi:hypothetical protein